MTFGALMERYLRVSAVQARSGNALRESLADMRLQINQIHTGLTLLLDSAEAGESDILFRNDDQHLTGNFKPQESGEVGLDESKIGDRLIHFQGALLNGVIDQTLAESSLPCRWLRGQEFDRGVVSSEFRGLTAWNRLSRER